MKSDKKRKTFHKARFELLRSINGILKGRKKSSSSESVMIHSCQNASTVAGKDHGKDWWNESVCLVSDNSVD